MSRYEKHSLGVLETLSHFGADFLVRLPAEYHDKRQRQLTTILQELKDRELRLQRELLAVRETRSRIEHSITSALRERLSNKHRSESNGRT